FIDVGCRLALRRGIDPDFAGNGIGLVIWTIGGVAEAGAAGYHPAAIAQMRRLVFADLRIDLAQALHRLALIGTDLATETDAIRTHAAAGGTASAIDQIRIGFGTARRIRIALLAQRRALDATRL